MAKIQTEIAAVMCGYWMHRSGYVPSTIMNIGVSSAPEHKIWKWLYPDAAIVGIDPKPQRTTWTSTYIQAAAHHVSDASYCRRCRSAMCRRADTHRDIFAVPTITVDDVAKEHKPPYFLWIDVDGAELSVLRGAASVLNMTGWVNIEIEGRQDHQAKIRRFLSDHDFVEAYAHRTTDRLFRNKTIRKWRGHAQQRPIEYHGPSGSVASRVRDEFNRFSKLCQKSRDGKFKNLLMWYRNALESVLEMFAKE